MYLASGGANDNVAGGIKCDSQYMNGNWQAPDYSSWNGVPEVTGSSSDVWDVRLIQLQPVDLRHIMWIPDTLEAMIPIMETVSQHGKRKDTDRMIR